MANYNPTNSMRFRAKFVMTAVFMVLFGLVAANFFRLSVIDNKKYQAMANDRHFGSISISAHRGSIYDSKGTAIAKSASVYKVYLDPKCFREELVELNKRIQKRNEEKSKGTYKPQYDKEGNEMNVLPESIEAFRSEVTSFISMKLGITSEKVQKAMEEDTQYSVLQEQVEKPVADELISYFNKYGMISLNVTEDTKRYYPQGELAASVIGFTNSDGNGLYGIEAYYDDYLSGIDGKTVSAKDSNGNELPYRYSKTYAAKNGDDIYLTIDSNIQYMLEKNLKKMVEDFKVKNRGCAILMNCKTGAIYGMATYPSFDLNDPYKINDPAAFAEVKQILDQKEAEKRTKEERETQWKNKCITERYEPGSVFKVLTSAAAIEENLIDFEKPYLVCNGSKSIVGAVHPIHCHQQGGHGVQTFQQALTNSCNPAFMEIGEAIGGDKFAYYCDAFGLAEKTGIDLPAESRGDIFTKETMTPLNLAVGSFGQGETVTPIEMITSYCAAVNGGYLLQPYVVEKIVDTEGNVVKRNERTVRRQVVSEDTSIKLRKCLEQVVATAPEHNVSIKGFSIGGKSGTSQRKMETVKEGDTIDFTQEEDASKEEYCASYVCFTPADDPELILLVMADMPDKTGDNYYGSRVAVPTAQDIMEEVLQYMHFSPEYTEDELRDLDVKVPLLEGSIDEAEATLKALGLKYEKIGSGIDVISQYPLTGTPMSKNGCVYLYTESGLTSEYRQVPDVRYNDLSNANAILQTSELNYSATGASPSAAGAYVAGQNIAPGTMVPKGTVIELEFKLPEVLFAD